MREEEVEEGEDLRGVVGVTGVEKGKDGGRELE